ncbi:endonuclease III [Candidatus Woesearchaeota archaeon]|nr:endonuclease III [Candidatus Woesearchaeota archaeon]
MTVDIDKAYSLLQRKVQEFRVPVVDLIQVQTKDPFKVLVATILSARTKDAVTVEACKRLFAKVSSPQQLQKVSLRKLEGLISPVGFFRNKAKYLKALPAHLERFDGKVPSEIDELLTLPGVGRKTANLVRAVAFSKDAICVDVHVHRIMNRLGYIKTSTPLQSEMVLRQKLPRRYWQTVNTVFVAFGQQVCRPVSPHCSKCPLSHLCPRNGVKTSR